MDFEGVWHAEEGETEAIILDYFRNIFKSDCPANFEASLDAIEESITHDMNRELLKDFKPDEVKRALNQMHLIALSSVELQVGIVHKLQRCLIFMRKNRGKS